LRDACSIALETGDLEYAAYSACVYSYHSYVLGKELTTVDREMAIYSQAIDRLNQETSYYYNQLDRQVVLNLMGRSEDKCRLIGDSYDETKMLPLHLEANAQNLCRTLYFFKLVLCYLFQDYQQALENAKLAEKYRDSAVGTIPLYHFYNSLVHLAIYYDAPKSEQKLILKKVKANQKKIAKWAQFSPMNHLHKFYLVEAERHRVLGENARAIDCYELAITLAKEYEYINDEALANELTAKFYLAWGKEQIAEVYMSNAYYCYLRWGAAAKATDLAAKYPQLLKRFTAANMSHKSRGNLSDTSNSTSGEILDLAALMKASGAIASEIELDKLLKSLMKILLESSGAQVGYLILESQGQLLVEASSEANSNRVVVLQSIPVETCLPLSIVHYVKRTQAGLIESDVTGEGRFTQDAYIKTRQPKSILCAPLMNQGQLIGIVYLENNLVNGVFTPERLEVIQLLSTQAAIALTNARLYTQVRATQNRLNKFLNAIPLGISVHDATGQIVYTNQVGQQLLNIQDLPKSATEKLSETYSVYRAGTGEIYPVEKLPLVRSLAGEKARADDLELHHSDRIVPLEATTTPIFDETGNVEYAIAAFQDISDRKQAETTLIENVRLEQEIRDRKQTEAELERAKEAAVAANLAKTTFLANMSHELRTPLNAILGFSQLMNDDPNLLSEQKENLNIIHRSGEHLLTMINQVLDLSKVEAGRMTLSENNFDLYHFLADIEDMFALKAKYQGLELRFECATDVPKYICADEVKLRQVLINLIGNAVKFTAAGSVSVKVTSQQFRTKRAAETQITSNQQVTTIIFEVKDTGFGIKADELEKLFKPFVQTASGQKLQQGTGLGLTISHQFIRLMGGEITVISDGKTFTPGMPVNELSDEKKPLPKSGTIFKFDISAVIAYRAIPNQSYQRHVVGLAPNQPLYRILVVDDKDDNRELLVKLLKPLGFEVQEATNGIEAIAIWDSYSPHLIWMDMRMPVMDGCEATKRIKSTTKGQATVIIALTASVWEEEKAVILSAGCDDFVRKPFRKAAIFDLLTKHLGVSYIYEESEISHPISPAIAEPLSLTDLLAAMPKTWIVKFHEAALDADAELVSQLLEEIPEFPDRELQTIGSWVNKFQFEKILDLTEPLVGEF
jgi:signal transduction histidine kinase/CheY-like chemotaxis protein